MFFLYVCPYLLSIFLLLVTISTTSFFPTPCVPMSTPNRLPLQTMTDISQLSITQTTIMLMTANVTQDGLIEKSPWSLLARQCNVTVCTCPQVVSIPTPSHTLYQSSKDAVSPIMPTTNPGIRLAVLQHVAIHVKFSASVLNLGSLDNNHVIEWNTNEMPNRIANKYECMEKFFHLDLNLFCNLPS